MMISQKSYDVIFHLWTFSSDGGVTSILNLKNISVTKMMKFTIKLSFEVMHHKPEGPLGFIFS